MLGSSRSDDSGPVTLSWVIGRGGLLGRSTASALAEVTEAWSWPASFRWEEPGIRIRLTAAVQAFASQAKGRDWCLAWCAGQGVVASTSASLARETAILDHLLTELGRQVDAGNVGRGALFHASSAGGVYAGALDPPFDERSTPHPLAPYGVSKLEQEALIDSWSVAHHVPAVIGRIANLFGPGQDLSKPQGFVSQLCWHQLRQRPIPIYVPLDTIRDYLYAPDCGRMIASALVSHDVYQQPVGARIKILASHRPLTIAALLGEFKRVVRQNVRASLVSSRLTKLQVRDLRLRSKELPHVDRLAVTSLPVGLQATHEDLRHRLALGLPSARTH